MKEWVEYKYGTGNDGVQEVLQVGEACSPGGGLIGSLEESKSKDRQRTGKQRPVQLIKQNNSLSYFRHNAPLREHHVPLSPFICPALFLFLPLRHGFRPSDCQICSGTTLCSSPRIVPARRSSHIPRTHRCPSSVFKMRCGRHLSTHQNCTIETPT
jgi:hypothetical protein